MYASLIVNTSSTIWDEVGASCNRLFGVRLLLRIGVKALLCEEWLVTQNL